MDYDLLHQRLLVREVKRDTSTIIYKIEGRRFRTGQKAKTLSFMYFFDFGSQKTPQTDKQIEKTLSVAAPAIIRCFARLLI
jgi:hypothetical protein